MLKLSDWTWQSSRNASTAASATADGIIVVDARAHILRINNAVTELTGFKQDELVGKHIKELGVKDSTTLEKLEAQIITSIYAKGYIKNLELAFLRKEGTLIPLELNATFFKSQEGKLLGGVAVIRDVSERKRAEETLRYRLKLEHLIADISTNFIKLSMDEIAHGVESALEAIGTFINVDRMHIFFLDRNKAMLNAADVQRVAREHLVPEKMMVLVVGKQSEIDLGDEKHPVTLASLAPGAKVTTLPLRDPMTMRPPVHP